MDLTSWGRFLWKGTGLFKTCPQLLTVPFHLFFFAAFSFADDFQVFKEANKLYESQNLQGAVSKYSALLKNGYVNWQIFYNLGDCYFRLNDLPKAHLYYLKAQRQNPRAADVKYNIEITRKALNLPARPSGFLVSFIKFFSLKEFKIIVTVIFWLVMGGATFYIITKREVLAWSAAFLFIIEIFFAVSLFAKSRYEEPGRWAVSLAGGNLMSGPGSGYKVIAQIPEGLEVEVFERENGWAFLSVPENRGWLEEENIGEI
ncbi:MAG: tetratricopeptide repeat protein [bacterium]